MLAILVVLPVAGSFGTSNHILDNTVYQLAPWFALISVLLAWLAHIWQARWLVGLGVVLAGSVALAQFYSGFVETPYRLPGGRFAQTEPSAIGSPATTLLLDPASHAFVESARAQLTSHGFKPGDDIFAFFNLPGLVFALGGVSPGKPWYFAGDAASLANDDMRVRYVAPARRDRAFLIRNGESWDAFLPYLRQAGLAFPEAYESCGPALKNPLTGETVELWCPRARATQP